MSPGHELLGGDVHPLRRRGATCAWIRSIFWSAATLSAALPSWLRPRTAFSTVRPMITMPGRPLLERDDADDRGAEQDELHQVAVLAQERLPARLLLRLRELVRADLRPAPLDLGGVETGPRIDLEPGACLVRGQTVRARVAAGLRTRPLDGGDTHRSILKRR